ncbi:MAG TPA: hypothetical protein VHX15_02610 [Frankiaceae bacterium]|jgi:hypothetical protein|nr:hypothetical protein [Frankiaceae bacterium]
MIIDCSTCIGRPTECGDCVVSVVLGSHAGGVDLDADEQTALAVLAGSGLVPPLRLMPAEIPVGDPRDAQAPAADRGTAARWSRRPRAG